MQSYDLYDINIPDSFNRSRQIYIVVTAPCGTITYANKYFQHRFRSISSNFIKLPFTSIVDKDNLDKYNAIIKDSLFKTDDNRLVELQTTTTEDILITLWEITVVRDDAGNPVCMQYTGTDITKASGLEKKQEKLRYQAMVLENVSDIIISCTNDHIVKSWNKKAEGFYNIKTEDAIGKKITELVQIDYSPGTRAAVHEILYEKGSWKGEVSYDRNGERKHLFNSLSFVTNEYGERIGIMVVGKDITDQKKAEENLKQSELFYRNLITDSLDGILLADEEGILHFTAPSIKNILGYEADEIIGRNIFEFVHPEDQVFALQTFRDKISKESDSKFIIIRLLKKNRMWLWCMVRGHNLLNNPYIGRMAVYFYDDSLRKKAESDLLRSESIKSAILDSSMDAIITINTEDTVIEWNIAAEKIFGYSAKEAVGQKMSNLIIPPSYRIAHLKGMQSLLDTRVGPLMGRQVEIPAMRKDGTEFPSELYISMINIEDKTFFTGTLRDITERKKLEQKSIGDEVNKQRVITKATIEGQEKERKEIGKELHDNIGQHLTTTQLYLDIARETADDATLELILLASKSISDIINEVRRISRALIPPTLGDLGLVDSINDLCEPIRSTQVFGIRFFHKNFSEDLLQENVKLMLFRIIQEQINNIIKHSEATTVLIRLISDEKQIILSITDNGKGFDFANIKKGLGINNIINRAELFNGKVEIDTKPGKGCMMIVNIPLALN